MKKNLPGLFSLLMVASLTLTACGGTTISIATTTPVVVTEVPTAATEVPVRRWEYTDMTVGLIQTGSEGGWRSANSASFKETATALGINLWFYDSAVEYKQTDALEQFIEAPEVDVIVIAPLEVTGWEESLQQAKDAGKIVIFEDRIIENISEELYTTYIGFDFTEEGRKAGREMCKLLEGSEKKNVWELVGNVRAAPAIDRGKGFRETATECGIVISKSQTANWVATDSRQITEGWLKESRDVQGIFAQNDDMGLGVIEALKEGGLAPAKDVKIVSIDATSAAFQAMLNGDLNATVECNPLFAPQVYEAALAALNGETLPKWIPVQESVFRMDDPNLQEIAAGRKY